MSLRTRFGSKFTGSTAEGHEANDPRKRWKSGKKAYLIDGLDEFKCAEDKDQKVRMLPQLEGNFWAEPVDVHFNVGPRKVSIACPKSGGKHSWCPACDLQTEWFTQASQIASAHNLKSKEDREKDPEYQKLKKISDQFRMNPYWVAHMLDEKIQIEERKPETWAFTNSAMEKIRVQATDRENKIPLHIDDPDKGRPIFFKKKKTGQYVEVEEVSCGNPGPIADESTPEGSALMDRVIAYLEKYPLKNCIIIPTPEEVKALMAGVDGTEEEESDGDEKGTVTNTGTDDPKESAPVAENTPASSTETSKEESAVSAPSESKKEEAKEDPKPVESVEATKDVPTANTAEAAVATAVKNVETPVTSTEKTASSSDESTMTSAEKIKAEMARRRAEKAAAK